MINSAALDRYITGNWGEDQFRGIWDEPYPPYRCRHCKAWVKMEPDKIRWWEESSTCDGSETIQDEPYSESIIGILGEDYRGKTYKLSISDCGVEVGKHEAHKIIHWAGSWLGWKCRNCGKWSVASQY